MSDDQTPQTPVSDGLPVAPPEPISEPMPEASASAPSAPAELQSEPEAPESESVPRTSGAASAASSQDAVSGKSPEHDRELLKIARAKIQTKKQEKLNKIMTLYEKKEKIANDDVEKLLHCSDATARRYLNELVKQGKLKRVGDTGAGVMYIKA